MLLNLDFVQVMIYDVSGGNIKVVSVKFRVISSVFK